MTRPPSNTPSSPLRNTPDSPIKPAVRIPWMPLEFLYGIGINIRKLFICSIGIFDFPDLIRRSEHCMPGDNITNLFQRERIRFDCE